MNYEKLDKKAILSWQIGRIIGFIVLCIILIVGLFFARKIPALSPNMHYFYIGTSILLGYKLIGIFLFPQIEYRQWRYMITEDKVEFRHGIFYVSTTIIPIVRIQHITVTRGPIYRKLGLSTVKIFLASGSFEIEGLSEHTADMITENLKTKVYQRLNKENNN